MPTCSSHRPDRIGFIVILFSRPLFKLYLPLAVVFHTSIGLTLDLWLHLVHWPLFLLAFDWNALLRASFSHDRILELPEGGRLRWRTTSGQRLAKRIH